MSWNHPPAPRIATTARNYGQLPEGGAIDVSGLGAGIYTLKFFGGSSKTQSARLVIR